MQKTHYFDEDRDDDDIYTRAVCGKRLILFGYIKRRLFYTTDKSKVTCRTCLKKINS
ncbi:MAG: hypothetical protein ACOC22_04440 [bacterium]